MKLIIGFSLLFSTLLPAGAHAQDIIDTPICFTIRNEAPYKVYGDITTNYFTNPDGIRARHSATFRLEPPETRNDDGHFIDRTEFCSQGPFYPGKQLELTLRTLFPIFSCKTSIELGEIVVKGQKQKDGSTKTWAVCY